MIKYNIWIDGHYPCDDIIAPPQLLVTNLEAESFYQACFSYYNHINLLNDHTLLFEHGRAYLDGRQLAMTGKDFVEYYNVKYPALYSRDKADYDKALKEDPKTYDYEKI